MAEVFDIGAIQGTALTIMIFVGFIVFASGILFVVIRAYLTWKRFNYTCIVFEKDGFGHPCMTFDKGGIFVDNKTGNKRFFLKNYNVGLRPDNIPYIVGNKGKMYVYLLRTGLKNFHFIRLNEMFSTEYPFIVDEEDVNWAINAYQRTKTVFGQSLLEKLIPYIGLIIMGVLILGMVVVVFQKIDVLRDVAIAFQKAAEAYAQHSSGTTIVKG